MVLGHVSVRRVRATISPLLAIAGLALLASCGEETSTSDGGLDAGASTDGGGMVAACPGPLPGAQVVCTQATCSATTGTKTFGHADLPGSTATSWNIVSWAHNELAGEAENTAIEYELTTVGGLRAREDARKAVLESGERAHEEARERARATLPGDLFELVFGERRLSRYRAETRIRSMGSKAPLSLDGVTGTAIRGRTNELIPRGAMRQTITCAATNPQTCGASRLCIIQENQTAGTCESNLAIKFSTNPPAFESVNATVRKVGEKVAIVVDDADLSSLSDADIGELVKRFDERIAPIDHLLFGEPRKDGKDRDGNGVAIMFFSSRVSAVPGSPVGYFFSDDLRTTAEAPHSNAADLLYLQPPSGDVTLDSLSGTMAHEYQHIINYYAKVILRSSSEEERWLDEGLAGFAEDATGYGADTFLNVPVFLSNVGIVSLTGNGFVDDPDGPERRGMAYLFVRYYFEQKGAATYGSGAAELTDGGGMQAVRKLVQSEDTGADLFTAALTGRAFDAWLADFLTTVAIDGTQIDGVSCNPKFTFLPPATDSYTDFQRGIDLRTAIQISSRMTLPLSGPDVNTFVTEASVPFPNNGGEIRTVRVSTGVARIKVGGPAMDYKIGFRAVPFAK